MANDHASGLAFGQVLAASFALEQAGHAAMSATYFIETNIGRVGETAAAVQADAIRKEAKRLRAIADRLDAALASSAVKLSEAA